jgi:hypothetical protein
MVTHNVAKSQRVENPTKTDIVVKLSHKIELDTVRVDTLNRYYESVQPLAWLTPEAAAQLGNRLTNLSVNFSQLAIDSLAERLVIDGFKLNGQPSQEIWDAWDSNGMPDLGQAMAHIEALTLGRSYVIVWQVEDEPTISVESASEVAADIDPLTREVTWAVKRWRDVTGIPHALLFGAEDVTEFTSTFVPEGGKLPTEGWKAVRRIPHSLAAVPVVELLNSGRVLKTDGVSEIDNIAAPIDALSKLLVDMMVSSEATAQPRRWVTGLQIEFDDEGNPVNPFSDDTKRMLQAEPENSHFGQFPAGSIDSFVDGVELLTKHIAALAALPAHYVGLEKAAPTSADAIRASEASLTARAEQKQKTFSRAWGRVGELVHALHTNTAVSRTNRVEPVWRDAGTRSTAQQTDAAVKLYTSGLIGRETALRMCGYSAEEILTIRREAIRAEADKSALSLPSSPTGDPAEVAA